MKRPNFFILGAPKCGTTSMAGWLAGHPSVFLSTPKEPTYFCTDLLPGRTRRLEEYERLFEAAGPRHAIVGEASTGYLYSRDAVPNILDYADAARFLVMVRNPLEMAPALHSEQLFQGNEAVEDFGRAWALQDARATGRHPDFVPPTCRDPQLLLYGPFCRLGEQLDRLYANVERDRVHVVVLDDVRTDARAVYLDTLKFLGLEDDGREAFPVRNAAKARRWPVLARSLRVVGTLRTRLGPTYRGLGLLNRLSEWNRAPLERAAPAPEMRRTLEAYFRDDVARLGELLDRDLSVWLSES